MTDFSDFTAQISEWCNREDWSPNLVASFVRMAEQKLNQELRVGRMIESVDGLIASRCAPIPDDWLAFSLVSISTPNVPTGWFPIRYKARDEFFRMPDAQSGQLAYDWPAKYYTIEGRQIYFGGAPDAVNGTTYRLSYFQEVPVFSDTQPSWVYTKYPSLYLSAALMHAYLHAVGEEQSAATAKQLAEDEIAKLNNEFNIQKASGSRLTRTRTRSFG